MAPTQPRGSSTIAPPGALSALLRELAAAPPSPEDAWSLPLHTGARVGRFELVRELGRGGFGVVWEGWDPELGRGVAVKCLRGGREGSPRDAGLYDEAEAAARLSHPNLVTLYDAGRAEQGPYLVLELLRGRTLADRLREGPIPVAEALRILADVARGVAHAHAKGIVHRDLKPGNVFLCEDGTAKVLDFGLAHAFGRARRDGGGTRGYMAPEQLAGAPEDERTDVFALGVILYEMLLGERPFESDRALASEREAAPLDIPDHAELAALVARMLRKSPVARPRDAGAVLDALAALGSAVAHASAGGVRRRARRVAPAAVAAAALVAGTSALVWRSHRAATRPARASVAVLPFSDLSPRKDQGYLADGVSEEIRSALSRVAGLRVVGETSSAFFKGHEAPLPVVGARLGATMVVEGSVRRIEDRIRVTARLVDVADGLQVWSETYDRALGDIFAVQEDVARRVALALRAGLLPAAGGANGERPAAVEAYAELLRGRALLASATGEDVRLAVTAMENAIALEPGYAAAHAGLCFAHLGVHTSPPVAAGDASLARAVDAADRAIALDPRNADAYQCRGVVRMTEFRWREARSDLETAVRLNPRPAPRGSYAWVLAAHGQLDTAIEAVEAVVADDPLDLGRVGQLATFLNAAGRSRRARQVLVDALDREPQAARLFVRLAMTEVLLRRPEEALAAARRSPHGWGAFVEALALHDLARPAESDAALATWEAFGRGGEYQVAEVHAWRGETDAAFEALDRALAMRDQGLRYLKYDPFLRALRPDPRYAALLRRMNLPVE